MAVPADPSDDGEPNSERCFVAQRAYIDPQTRTRRAFSAGVWALVAVAVGMALWLALGGPARCSGEPARDVANLVPATVVHVSDGDTLLVRLDDGQEGYVRLTGVDAPESVNPDESLNTPEGEAAAAFTRSLVQPGQRVWLARDITDTDTYGRWLRYVWLEVPNDVRDEDEVQAKMLNAILVAAGHAASRAYAPDTAYAEVFERLEGR